MDDIDEFAAATTSAKAAEKKAAEKADAACLETALERLMGLADVLSCALTPLSPRDLAAASSTCRTFRSTIREVVVPDRLEKARATAKKHGFKVAEKPPEMSLVEYVHEAELAAAAASDSIAQKAKKQRENLAHFLDHILVEAAMRGQLGQYEPRVEALREKANDLTIDADKIHEEATDLEAQIMFGSLFGAMGGLTMLNLG
jgi:nucleotide-binding universal stress UspA family protein